MSGSSYVYVWKVDGVPRYVGKGRGARCFDHIDKGRTFATIPGATVHTYPCPTPLAELAEHILIKYSRVTLDNERIPGTESGRRLYEIVWQEMDHISVPTLQKTHAFSGFIQDLCDLFGGHFLPSLKVEALSERPSVSVLETNP